MATKQLFIRLSILVLILTPTLWVRAVSYKLVKVTSVEAGSMYVFEQKGRVMINSVSDGSIGTTSKYNTSGLTGTENYIWSLEEGTNGYYIKNSNDRYLYSSSSSNNLAFKSNRNDAKQWTFTYNNVNPENTFFVIEEYISKRFIGYINETEYIYKAYQWTNNSVIDARTPYFITIYKLVEETSEDVTLTAASVATYVSNYDLDYSEVEGLTAYKAKVSGNNITFTPVDAVPAGEGVLLKASEELTESTTYTVPFATTSPSWAADDNDFVRGTGAAVLSEDNGNYNYILNNGSKGIGFYRANNQIVGTNRAYLSTTTAPDAGSPMAMYFNEEPTAITAPVIDKQKNIIYNLQGQRVSDPAKGLYIINGKKN